MDISHSWPRESSVCCLWLLLPPGVGGCVCACMFTPADHSPRGRWHDGALVVVSRLRSAEPIPGHFLFPLLCPGDMRCPGLQPPGPTSSSQEDPWVLPACGPGRKLCRQCTAAVSGSASSAPPSGITVLSRAVSETFVGWGLSPVLTAFSRWKQTSC